MAGGGGEVSRRRKKKEGEERGAGTRWGGLTLRDIKEAVVDEIRSCMCVCVCAAVVCFLTFFSFYGVIDASLLFRKKIFLLFLCRLLPSSAYLLIINHPLFRGQRTFLY